MFDRPCFRFFLCILMAKIFNNSEAIVGYDCVPSCCNITTIILLDVGKCDLPVSNVNTTTTQIQLLQLNEYRDTKVIQCKIGISLIINHCGMQYHTSVVSGGMKEYLLDVFRDMCTKIHVSSYIKNANISIYYYLLC